MVTKMYSFFDKKAGCYLTPFFSQADGSATRVATDLVSDPNTVMGRHPADFSLVLIGSFDDQLGLVSPFVPQPVCECVSLVRQQPSLPFQRQSYEQLLDSLAPVPPAAGNGLGHAE